MNTNQTSTTEELNNIIEFRQQMYDQILGKGQDAQFELVDALLLSGKIGCFAELSQSPVFRRKWGSAYQAIKKGEISEYWLERIFTEQVPQEGIQIYPLDTTVWAHPKARTLEGLVYAPSPTKALKKGSIVQGHQYSMLTWTPECRQSWSMTISNRRLEPEQGAIEVGLEQVTALCQARKSPLQQVLDVIVGDGAYGNHTFFGPIKELEWCAGLARMRRDRVLYGVPPAYSGCGRPRKHGERFAFKEPESWPEPDEMMEVEHDRWGKVRLRRWNKLHAKQDATISFAVIMAEVHLERDDPPKPLWLGYVPGHTDHPVDVVWSWFDYRWPIEPSIRFRKQALHWTLPRFQDGQACDHWTHLVDLAFWQLFLARPVVQDQPLPWQKPQTRLTPYRTKQGLGSIFSQFGTPAQSPQTRGKSPGWLPGRPRTKPERFKPVKRAKSKAKST